MKYKTLPMCILLHSSKINAVFIVNSRIHVDISSVATHFSSLKIVALFVAFMGIDVNRKCGPSIRILYKTQFLFSKCRPSPIH